MNIEEGELAPGLSDHFGMVVPMPPEHDAAVRRQIVRNAIAYEQNRSSFSAEWAEETRRLQTTIREAQTRLDEMTVGDSLLQLAATVSIQSNCTGHRADVYLVEAAKAIAALEKRTEVDAAHIRQAAEYVLSHRVRRGKHEEQPTGLSEQQANPPFGDDDPATPEYSAPPNRNQDTLHLEEAANSQMLDERQKKLRRLNRSIKSEKPCSSSIF